MLFKHFEDASNECKRCLSEGLPLSRLYDPGMKPLKTFNFGNGQKSQFLQGSKEQNYNPKNKGVYSQRGVAQGFYKIPQEEREGGN